MDQKFLQKQLLDFFRDLTSLGGMTVYVLITVFYTSSPLLTDLLFGFFFTAAAVVAIRGFYFKDRPKKEEYAGFIGRVAASAFPSLHAARAAFLAMLFSAYYGSNYLTGLFIIIAIAVSYSRIYLQKHDYADVFWGVILGAITFIISWYLLPP